MYSDFDETVNWTVKNDAFVSLVEDAKFCGQLFQI